ncbi:hypothetical protein GmHk_04G010091 [Glycine max]|nr:hypothetical protein GmHk_04G010091 [Glycine max]
MGSPPASTTPPPPPSSPSHPRPPPTSDASASTSAVKRARKASCLRSLSTRPPRVERPVVHVDPATGKADGPHRKKLRTHLGIAARDKVDITYENWKEVPTAQKDLIWEDIQTKFDILEASDSRTKRKLLQTVGERWRHFKSDLTRKWALASDQDGVEDTVCDKYGISKEKWAQFCQTRRDPSWEDVRIKAQAIQKQNTAPHVVVSPPKPPPKPDPEVRWDATVFGVVNPDFPLYIKHEDLSKIAHDGQCLSISLHKELDAEFTTRCVSWSLSKWRTLEDGGHPAQGTLSCLGLDDAPQPKSKAPASGLSSRQKGSTKCGYYVMHWMSTIILGTFRNNWEAYFNDPRPLEPERLTALRIQWAQFYLRQGRRSPQEEIKNILGIVARDKVDVMYENWKEEFEIPEASESRTKKKRFKSYLTRKWALAADQNSVDDTVYEKYNISKEKWAQFCHTRRDPSWENTAPHILSRGGYEYLKQKLLAEKTKKKLEEAT